MAIQIKPGLADELHEYGATDIDKCFNCGNCSAVCVHSEGDYILPRRPLHAVQVGLEDKLKGDIEPWLCYYCGECSEQCPKEADPAETMMSMRRWLTAKYDFSGLSGLFYRSPAWEIIAIVIAAILTGIGFVAFGILNGGSFSVYDGENAFLPSHYVHRFDWGMAIILVGLLGINVLRMWRNVMGGSGAGIGSYLAALPQLPYQFFTQTKMRRCDRKRPWAVHMVLMLSYVTMLVLIMFFLRYMQAGPEIDWRVHAFGYLASIGLIAAVILNIRGRLKKDAPQHAHSHESDWMFLYLLLYVAVTGVLQTALHRLGFDAAANAMYIIHLMGIVPMLVLEVPFGKWAHLAYRPLALYFSRVKVHAEETEAATGQKAAEAA
ncbi:MAG TPA: 4Fe-4S dicluster domain-containing protein [Thermoleophilia bacterium]|nr:4Fe-4S dicluster domain-containing protein [Thermoleophilia bacterium]